jgi:hypothetical protein
VRLNHAATRAVCSLPSQTSACWGLATLRLAGSRQARRRLGRIAAGKVENGIVSGLDWFPTFVAAAGNPNIAGEFTKGKQLGDQAFKVHLDGYNQMT